MHNLHIMDTWWECYLFSNNILGDILHACTEINSIKCKMVIKHQKIVKLVKYIQIIVNLVKL